MPKASPTQKKGPGSASGQRTGARKKVRSNCKRSVGRSFVGAGNLATSQNLRHRTGAMHRYGPATVAGPTESSSRPRNRCGVYRTSRPGNRCRAYRKRKPPLPAGASEAIGAEARKRACVGVRSVSALGPAAKGDRRATLSLPVFLFVYLLTANHRHHQRHHNQRNDALHCYLIPFLEMRSGAGQPRRVIQCYPCA
jgi:hypothetical protein